MADVSKQFEIFIASEIIKNISKGTIRKAANAAGKAAIDAIRERTANGIDYTGKRIPALTKEYSFRKRTQLRKLLKGRKTTQFKAKGVPNHGRLSGEFFSAMKFKIIKTQILKNNISIDVSLYLKGDQDKKVRWLESSTGATKGWFGRGKKTTYSKAQRFIWGLSQQGKWKTREEEMIKQAFIKNFVQNSKVEVRT